MTVASLSAKRDVIHCKSLSLIPAPIPPLFALPKAQAPWQLAVPGTFLFSGPHSFEEHANHRALLFTVETEGDCGLFHSQLRQQEDY